VTPCETLTSRQRVCRTLRREPVDRMPIDLGMHPSTGISAFAYQRLRRHLGLPAETVRVHDCVQMLARVDEDVRRRFHVDCIELEPPWHATHVWRPQGDFAFEVPAEFRPESVDSGGWTVRQGADAMHMPPGSYFFDGAWLSNWSGVDEERAMDAYAREAERVFKETEYATCFVGYSWGGGLEAFFTGFDQAMQMLEDPDSVKAENEARLGRNLRRAERIVERLGPFVQMVAIGNDMGMQTGPMVRPALMEACVFPYYARLCRFFHEHSDLKVFLHNCGSIRAYLPALIDAGIDVLNPVQISAADMDPSALKRDFGHRLVFWGGGCDTQNVLTRATPERVANHVRGLIDIFGHDGGFVFNQVHNVMADVPPENVVALFDTACAAGSASRSV
jgi:uroporphyrinogen decarboxylase